MKKKCCRDCNCCCNEGSVAITLYRRSGNDWLAVDDPIETDLYFDNERQSVEAKKPLDFFAKENFNTTRMAVSVEMKRRIIFHEVGMYPGYRKGKFDLHFDTGMLFL